MKNKKVKALVWGLVVALAVSIISPVTYNAVAEETTVVSEEEVSEDIPKENVKETDAPEEEKAETTVDANKASDSDEAVAKVENVSEQTVTETDAQVNASENGTPSEKVAKQSEDEENKIDNSTDNANDVDDSNNNSENSNDSDNTEEKDGLADGVYKPDSFTFTGGTGKVTITCPEVYIKDGKAYADIVFSSSSYKELYVDGVKYNSTEYASGGSLFSKVSVELNKSMTIAGTTYAMSEPHTVEYTIVISLSTETEKKEDLNPDDDFSNHGGSGNSNQTNTSGSTTPEKTPTTLPATKQTLTDGTYKVLSDTDNRMFYIAQDASGKKYSMLKVEKGSYTATITLTGQGYDYLYMGSVKDAENAKKSSLSKFKEVDGFYTYTFPILALDKKLTISAHSKRLDQWFEHTIIFYSGDAVKLKNGETITPVKKKSSKGGSTSKKKSSKKSQKVSKSYKDTNSSTSAVDNGTGLKDGNYTPDSFSWSGGSGRLAYIRCTNILVKGGKTYATIEFSSTKYDSLKANGQVYSGHGTFTIPVKLNQNNKIVGRTTAMSSPHWITYTIYIGLNAAKNADDATSAVSDVDKEKLSGDKVPVIAGLSGGKALELKDAEKFTLYQYDGGYCLLQIDLANDSAYADMVKEAAKESGESKTTTVDGIEYDEDGNAIAKSQSDIMMELYQNSVVNYLIVPEGKIVPAGLDKEMLIVNIPAKNAYIASDAALTNMSKFSMVEGIATIGLNAADVTDATVKAAIEKGDIAEAGDIENPEFRTLIQAETDLAILPAEVLPKYETTDEKAKPSDEELAKAKESYDTVVKLAKRYATIDVPMIIDRSTDEKTEKGAAEWSYVYEALSGKLEVK